MKWSLIIVVVFSVMGFARADVYLEVGIEGGGETFATARGSNNIFSPDKDLNIGGGLKIAGGYFRYIGPNDANSISLGIGYLWDSIDAENGDAEFSTLIFDAVYSMHRNAHQFGIGASYHIGPEYEDDIEGFAPTNFDFDDSLGLVLQYRYLFDTGFYLGLRYTEIDYAIRGVDVDAGSVGLLIGLSGEW